MIGRGHIVVQGVNISIVDVRLRGGMIHVEAYSHGPLPAAEGTVTIFGEDGVGIAQYDSKTVKWEELGELNFISIDIPLEINSILEKK